MDVCLINNHLPNFSFMSFIATLQLRLFDCHNSTRKCWNKLKTLHTIQALVWQWNARENQSFTVTGTVFAASHCALAIVLTVATWMVWVVLGKHQVAQQLVRHPCSVRSEQTAMAWNLFNWCLCTWCTKTLSKSGFMHANCFVIPHKIPRYSGLISVKYQLNECKIWSNDSMQRNVPLSCHSSRSWKYQDFFIKTKTKTSSRARSRPRLLLQDKDHFSCPQGSSRTRPRYRDYIPALYWITTNLPLSHTPHGHLAAFCIDFWRSPLIITLVLFTFTLMPLFCTLSQYRQQTVGQLQLPAVPKTVTCLPQYKPRPLEAAIF